MKKADWLFYLFNVYIIAFIVAAVLGLPIGIMQAFNFLSVIVAIAFLILMLRFKNFSSMPVHRPENDD